MNQMKNISASEWQLLSAYLDDQVSSDERIQIERKLDSDAAFRQAMLSLQKTRLVIRSMPRRKVPRNFTLTSEMVPVRGTFQLFPLLRFSSAFAAIAAVVLFAVQLLPGMFNAGTQMAAPAAVDMTAAENASGPVPPMIYWGSPPLATGKGGGGGGDGSSASVYPGGMGGGAPDTVFGVPSGAATPGIQFEIPQPTNPAGIGGAAVLEATPTVASALPLEPTPAATGTQVPPLTLAPEPTAGPETQRSQATLSGNPVLGLRPQDSGKVIADSQPLENTTATQEHPTPAGRALLLPAAIGLAVLAAVTAIAAWIIWKKSHN
ncbi:MAG TPA: hypothetical protein VN452_03325 [Longilinea sp.]|nr:hypothetical protein [Longilinea sp.]